MNINKLLRLNEEGLNDNILKSISTELMINKKIDTIKIKNEISKYYHLMMRQLIESKIKEELKKIR